MLLLLAALALVLAACEGTAEPTATTQPAVAGPEIVISGFAFTGASTAQVGDTVTVTNQDSVSHTWTSRDDVFDSGTLSNGEIFEFTFDEPGEYGFFCEIHPTTMNGRIVVEES